MTAGVVIHNVKETMMHLEQHIEELRLEKNASVDPAERRRLELELELACAELAVIIAEQDGQVSAEPPF
ncbi:hypothetical protein N7E02_03985 (plasmid) [Aliirhizobium terrae]|uniref:hypothetical protein n=1 Tax=Terrirhizobium terrae TaxID=2926709 RepID=UPI00257742AE|nr:hypothetical protein [Rhizobium sp. CC-CFT758]WJH38894.1 hypothetical protein N7E02_03985 [Rhizobium sp. CC-CFT758]